MKKVLCLIMALGFAAFALGCGVQIADSNGPDDYTLAEITEENIRTFAETVLQDINPRNSWRAGRALRRHISVVMAERALRECVILAGGEING